MRAAFLTCCVEAKGLTPGVERVLRAAAHRETGAPVTVHTSSPTHAGRLLLQVFREEGVDLAEVVVGRAGDSNGLDYLTELADAGCVLGMDRFRSGPLQPHRRPGRDDRRARRAELRRPHRALARRELLHRLLPRRGAGRTRAGHPELDTHISNDVLPALRERGVTDTQITQMLVEVPRRDFS